MQNPYQTLGVNRDATADDIKRAYRKLASKHHPDRGGDTKTFQEIQTAYDTLSDPKRRSAYDNPHSHMHSGLGDQPFDFATIFDIFGARFQQPHMRPRSQARVTLWVTLKDVAQGAKKTVSVGTPYGSQTIEMQIPLGINDGDSVNYSGLAPGGTDLVVTYRIHPAPQWERHGANLTTTVTITVWQCILGAQIEVTDILGNILSLTVPPNTQPGTMLRLRERGLRQHNGPTGDLMIRIQARIPANIDPELRYMIEQRGGQ